MSSSNDGPLGSAARVTTVSTGVGRIERSNSGLADEVYARLVNALLQGALAPGDRLIQDRLAEDLDVSRTPVRDALLRLNEEGVIEPSGRRGYVVRSLTAKDVGQIYEARFAIEGHAAAITARLGGEALERVRLAMSQVTVTPATTEASFDANRNVHRAIVMATGNPHLLGFFDAIWGRALTGLAYHDFYVAMPYEEFIEDHQLLVDEIAKGKPEVARKAMIDHIRRGIERTPILDIDLP